MGESLLASVEVTVEGSQTASLASTGYRLEAVFFHFTVLAVISLKPRGTWNWDLLTSLSFCDWKSTVQPVLIPGWPDQWRIQNNSRAEYAAGFASPPDRFAA